LIRDDAKVFFRRANITEEADVGPGKVWSEDNLQYIDSFSEADPEEASHAQVLHYINEFLPMRELVGRIIDVRTLRQFGLIGNEKLDHFLSTTLGPVPTRTEVAAKVDEVTSEKLATQPVQE